ncbi:MAG: hypothetical protein C0410_07290 [Anaerolinea sp.]|nr:hypothetical protein [Anaerolinea sp.]
MQSIFFTGINRGKLIYYTESPSSDQYFQFDLLTRRESLVIEDVFFDQDMVDEIGKKTNRNPSLPFFYPSPNYKKILFAELISPVTKTQSSVLPTPTKDTSGELFKLTESLIFELYIFDVDKEEIINLGNFSGDFGEVFWSEDNNTVFVNRGFTGYYDCYSPIGIWQISIPNRTITKIHIDDEKEMELSPRLFSDDGTKIIFQYVSSDSRKNLYLFNSIDKSIRELPIEKPNSIWWLEDGKEVAYLSNCGDWSSVKIEGFSIDKMSPLQSKDECFSFNPFASHHVVGFGKYIVFYREGSKSLFARTVILSK